MGADVLRFSSPAGPRTPAEIEAAMRTHVEALKALALELAAAQGYDPTGHRQHADQPGEVLSLQRAAYAIGWTERRLRRHIVKHNRAHPRDPIGHQPGGMANTAWCIPMARLRRYVRDQRE